MKVMAAVMAFVAGEAMNVRQVCVEAEISRQTFYKYAARCRAEGVAGFEPRSRRPLSDPASGPVDVEDAVIAWRKQLEDAGLDHGATTIQWHLGRDERFTAKVPSAATVHRILVRRGFVTAQPQKRPKSSWHRFEASAPNEWWQIDSTDWVIATGLVKIFNIVDDHSRVGCESRAVAEATGEEAWTTFCAAVQEWGLPAGGAVGQRAVLLRASCAASRCCSKPGCVMPGSAQSPDARITHRPPARSNGSSRPSRSGCAAKTTVTAWPVTSPSCRPVSTRSAATTTSNDPIKASGGSPRCRVGRPPHRPLARRHTVAAPRTGLASRTTPSDRQQCRCRPR